MVWRCGEIGLDLTGGRVAGEAVAGVTIIGEGNARAVVCWTEDGARILGRPA